MYACRKRNVRRKVLQDGDDNVDAAIELGNDADSQVSCEHVACCG